MKNWSIENTNYEFWSEKNVILKKIGLAIKIYKIEDYNDFIPAIKNNIDNLSPVFMIVKYKSLFYNSHYETSSPDSSYNHCVLISGYDPDRKLIVIREWSHVHAALSKDVRGIPLFELQLTEDMVYDIWEKTNLYYEEEDSIFCNMLYSIERIGDYQINSYTELIKDFIKNCDYNHSNLIKVLNGFEESIDDIGTEIGSQRLRRTFVNSLFILFDVIEKTFDFLLFNGEKRDKYYDFKTKYMEFREKTISILIKNTMRGKDIDSDKKHRMIEESKCMDRDLFSLIKEFCEESDRQIGNNRLSDTSVVYIPIEDTYARNGNYSMTNYGLNEFFVVATSTVNDYSREAYMKFDLSDFKAEKCSSAVLKIFYLGVQEISHIQIYEVEDNSWIETKLNWQNRPISSNIPISSQTIYNTNVWYDFDVTTFINNRLSSNRIVSICLKNLSSFIEHGMDFSSKDAAKNKPFLEIEPIQKK